MAGGHWSDSENDLIVADYFAMLRDDFAREPYNKAAHNRDLQDRIGRSKQSIEYKHRNISAVLQGLGEIWIPGYRPAFNYQNSLEDAVQRWLVRHEDWMTRLPPAVQSGFEDAGTLYMEPAPTLRNEPPPDELEQTLAAAARFDIAGRDERNRVLGRAGEARVLEHERANLSDHGRPDLARQIVWVSEEIGDGAGYDIESFEVDGSRRLIEVKTTNGWQRTPFYISRNELAQADVHRAEWCLVRLYNFSKGARAFELRPPLDAHVSLTPTTFQASFR